MKWLLARARILPAVFRDDEAFGLTVPWVNGCSIVPMLVRSGMTPFSVPPADVREWADQAALLGEHSTMLREDAKGLRRDPAGFLLALSIENLKMAPVGMRLMRGQGGLMCFGSSMADGFRPSMLLYPGMFSQCCCAMGGRSQFYAAAPCRDVLAIYRTQAEAQQFLDSPALRESPCPHALTLDMFVLTRDGVAGMREEASACG